MRYDYDLPPYSYGDDDEPEDDREDGYTRTEDADNSNYPEEEDSYDFPASWEDWPSEQEDEQ